jgi:hypothetical protein
VPHPLVSGLRGLAPDPAPRVPSCSFRMVTGSGWSAAATAVPRTLSREDLTRLSGMTRFAMFCLVGQRSEPEAESKGFRVVRGKDG